MKFPCYRKWDIVWCDFPESPKSGHVVYGRHPAIVISNSLVCANASTVMVVPGTSNLRAESISFGQVYMPANKALGLPLTTRFDTGKIITLDVKNIQSCCGTLLNTSFRQKMQDALQQTFELSLNNSLSNPSALESAELEAEPEVSAEMPAPKESKKTMLYMFCPHCGSKFVVPCENEIPDQVECRNCNCILDTTPDNLHKYCVHCDDCGITWKGVTNADPKTDKVTRCRCGNRIKMSYDKDTDTVTERKQENQ